jgi:hypothetical protein
MAAAGCLIFQMILPLSFLFSHLILAVKAKLSFLNYVDGVYSVQCLPAFYWSAMIENFLLPLSLFPIG